MSVRKGRWSRSVYAQAQAAALGTDAPNDIFIVNDNPRLRDFAVVAGTTVKVVCFEGDAGCPSADSVSGAIPSISLPVEEWIAQGGAGRPGNLFGRASNLFYITIDGGQVVDIEEQYVP